MVCNKRYQKKKNMYLAYYQPILKKHLKDKLSKDFFVGKRSCSYFVIRHRGESDAFG